MHQNARPSTHNTLQTSFVLVGEPPGRVSYIKMTCEKLKMHDVTREMVFKVAGWYPIIEMLLQSCITSIVSYCFAAVRTLNATQSKVELI